MIIDILDMGRYNDDAQAIDVALPVLAIECEATPPMQNYLDAYEETVLKLVSIGLSTHGIAQTLKATESLIEEILSQLELKAYTVHEIGKPWKLTEDGQKYLDGTIKERASSESQYGYMFVNAIKKEVLPFFYQGDVGQISLFRGKSFPLRMTLEGDEDKTFESPLIKQSALKKAYKSYFRNLETAKELEDGNISKEEAVDIFADLESFDAEGEEPDTTDTDDKPTSLKGNMFIRALKKSPKKLYLHMRIIIDPCYPGGYRAESPFDFGGIDNGYFLRQIQWLEQSGSTYLGGEDFQTFLNREICKLSPSYKTSEKDFQVFVMERLPLLKIFRSRFPYIYEDMERIYSLMQRQNSLLEKENIVNNLARSVVEGLFNAYFRNIDQAKLDQIQQKAFDDVRTYGYVIYKKRICHNVGLPEDTFQWIKEQYLRTVLGRLNYTYGNSIMEKFINMLVIEYHFSNIHIKQFLHQPDIIGKYGMIDKLNRIRRKVSHDTDDRFTNDDYKFYMANVFNMINDLLEAFRED